MPQVLVGAVEVHVADAVAAPDHGLRHDRPGEADAGAEVVPIGIDQGAVLAGEATERFGFAVRAMTIDFLKPARKFFPSLKALSLPPYFMKKSQPQNSKEAFGVQDVIYILFKHKWKIVILSLLGFTASAAVYLNRKPLYESQAKLLVRYVLNRNTVDPFQSQMNPTGGPGDSIINTEIEILNSEDLAKAVAEAVGVEKLLPLSGGNAKVEDGAGLIRSQLTVAVAPGSNVVHINYSDADPDLSVAVLGELVQQYFIKHLQIHRSANAFELLQYHLELFVSR
jgi:capsular polysaccharide biosynthesis protein